MKQKGQRFDTQALTQEAQALTRDVVTAPFRLRTYRLIRKILIGFILVSIANVLFSYFFYTPKMYRILRDNRETVIKYRILQDRIRTAQQRVDEIRHRDNYVYRSLFSTDTLSIPGVWQPYPDSKYAPLAGDDYAPLMIPAWKELDALARTRTKDESLAIIDKDDRVHMAHMDIHFTHSTNGVAALHTEILKNSELHGFYELYPEKFNNKTNGITFRRWLLHCNHELADLIESLIGPGFKKDAMELEKLGALVDDASVLQRLLDVKNSRKTELKDYLAKTQGIVLDDNSIYDIQIKRLHEYKRQQMNALYVIHKYFEIKAGKKPTRPITVIFGAKAPAYIIAKDIIHLILCLSELIAKDPEVSPYLKVVMVENYNVTLAEKLIPAADIHEQISLASKEASGTSNMKFMLNGAVAIGTMDGANVEMHQFVGDDNIYIFGESSEEVIKHYEKADYVSRSYYENDANIKRAVDFIVSDEMMAVGCRENLERLYNELLNKDWFMTLPDFEDYMATKERIYADYEDRMAWAKKMLINISKAGFFSSDRTIAQYNEDIWHL